MGPNAVGLVRALGRGSTLSVPTLWEWDTTGLVYDGTGTQWDWYVHKDGGRLSLSQHHCVPAFGMGHSGSGIR